MNGCAKDHWRFQSGAQPQISTLPEVGKQVCDSGSKLRLGKMRLWKTVANRDQIISNQKDCASPVKHLFVSSIAAQRRAGRLPTGKVSLGWSGMFLAATSGPQSLEYFGKFWRTEYAR